MSKYINTMWHNDDMIYDMIVLFSVILYYDIWYNDILCNIIVCVCILYAMTVCVWLLILFYCVNEILLIYY